MIKQLDEGASVEELSQRFSNMTGDELRTFILRNYGELLVDGSGGSFASQPAWPQAASKNGLSVSWAIVPRTVTIAIASRLTLLLNPLVAAVSFAAIVISHLLVYSHNEMAHARLTDAHVSVVLMLCIVSILVHELGHASALVRYGGSPSGIGFGLFILLPVFYADVSQAWKLHRWQRIVVDIGGVYFQQLFFVPTALLSMALASASMRAVCVAIDVMTLIALNPAFRFDGYWVIADWLGLTHLHRSAAQYLRSSLASLAGSRSWKGSGYPCHLRGAKAAVFIGYALLSNAFLAVLIALNVRWVYSTMLALCSGLPQLGRAFLTALKEGNWVGSGDLAVACAFLLASGVTLMVGVGWQARSVVQFVRRRYSPARDTASRPLGEQL